MGQVVGVGRLGQAEVGHPHVAVVVQKQVRWLDVAVENALTIGVFQGLGDLDADTGDAAVKLAVRIGRRCRQRRARQDRRRRVCRKPGRLRRRPETRPEARSRTSGQRPISVESAGDQRAAISTADARQSRLDAALAHAARLASNLACRSRRRSSSTSSSPRPAMNCITK